MEVGLVVLGILIGIALTYYHLDREYERETNARVAALEEKLAGLQRAAPAAGEPAPAAAPAPEATAAAAASISGEPSEEARKTLPPKAAARPAGSADDLTRIKGIGPVIARKLEGMGITTYRQLAELSPEEIAKVNAAIEFPGRVERERWVEQARSFSAG